MVSNLFECASQFIDTQEMPGDIDNPLIVAMLQSCDRSVTHDEVPWCSAFVNFICMCMNVPRSKSLAAKSWLKVGIVTTYPVIGRSIVILNRGSNSAQGHVGFFAGFGSNDEIHILGGNQSNRVCVEPFRVTDIVGYRDLVV